MKSSSDTAPSESTAASDDVATSSKYTWLLRKTLLALYEPHADSDAPFLRRLESQTSGGVTAKVSVLTASESRRYFGVPLARRGLQSVYIEIDNSAGDSSVFLDRVRIDPNYFSATEAAARCRLASVRILAETGLLSAALFLPLALLLPLKLLTAGPANRRMEQFFRNEALPLGIFLPVRHSGIIYTSLDTGVKSSSRFDWGKKD